MNKKIRVGAVLFTLLLAAISTLNGCGKDEAKEATFTLKSSNSAS